MKSRALRTLACAFALLLLAWAATAAADGAADPRDVLRFAGGTPIGDGRAHTVGQAPPGSIFHGVSTLAGLAGLAIHGAAPFAFLTDAGARTGPMATPDGRINPFVAATGAYRLTDADVPALDIAWLAIQASLLAGRSVLPAGTYVIGSARPLPLMLPLSYDGDGVPAGIPTRIVGDGEGISILKAGSDFGANVPLMACGDPAATVANRLGRFNGGRSDCAGSVEALQLVGPGASWLWAPGAVSYRMDGFAPGPHLRTQDVEVDGFDHDWMIDGDHTLHIRPVAKGGAHGFFWDGPNPALSGDLQFQGLVSAGASIDAIEVGQNATISADFAGETYLSAPFAIRGDASASCAPIVHDAHFTHLMAEYIGHAVIADDTGFDPAAAAYDDARKCRSLTKLVIDDFYWSYDNAKWIAGRQRRAVVDVNDISGSVEGLQADSGVQAPNVVAAPRGQASRPVAIFNVRSAENAFGGFKISGNLDRLIAQAGTIPLVPADLAVPEYIALEQPGVWTGGLAQLHAVGTYTASTAGDLLEPDHHDGAVPAGTHAGGVALGVAMQGGLAAAGVRTGAWVPYASAGSALVNIGWVAGGLGPYAKGSGIGVTIALSPGSGYADGVYPWMSENGGCGTPAAGTVTVRGGGLAGYTIARQGAGCVSAPTIPVPAAAGGGRDGAITPSWPGALAARSTDDAARVIGSAIDEDARMAGGARQVLLRLIGMQ